MGSALTRRRPSSSNGSEHSDNTQHDHSHQLTSLTDSPNEPTANANEPAELDAHPIGSPKLRSTLAIGQIIAASKPSAGSKLIAQELRELSLTIKEESGQLRKDLVSMSEGFANSLKSIVEEERELRSTSSSNPFLRRPSFGLFPTRRFPIYRRSRRLTFPSIHKSAIPGLGSDSPVHPISPERTPVSLMAGPEQPTASKTSKTATVKEMPVAFGAKSASTVTGADAGTPLVPAVTKVVSEPTRSPLRATQSPPARETTTGASKTAPGLASEAAARSITWKRVVKQIEALKNVIPQLRSVQIHPWMPGERHLTFLDDEMDGNISDVSSDSPDG